MTDPSTKLDAFRSLEAAPGGPHPDSPSPAVPPTDTTATAATSTALQITWLPEVKQSHAEQKRPLVRVVVNDAAAFGVHLDTLRKHCDQFTEDRKEFALRDFPLGAELFVAFVRSFYGAFSFRNHITPGNLVHVALAAEMLGARSVLEAVQQLLCRPLGIPVLERLRARVRAEPPQRQALLTRENGVLEAVLRAAWRAIYFTRWQQLKQAFGETARFDAASLRLPAWTRSLPLPDFAAFVRVGDAWATAAAAEQTQGTQQGQQGSAAATAATPDPPRWPTDASASESQAFDRMLSSMQFEPAGGATMARERLLAELLQDYLQNAPAAAAIAWTGGFAGACEQRETAFLVQRLKQAQERSGGGSGGSSGGDSASGGLPSGIRETAATATAT